MLENDKCYEIGWDGIIWEVSVYSKDRVRIVLGVVVLLRNNCEIIVEINFYFLFVILIVVEC